MPGWDSGRTKLHSVLQNCPALSPLPASEHVMHLPGMPSLILFYLEKTAHSLRSSSAITSRKPHWSTPSSWIESSSHSFPPSHYYIRPLATLACDGLCSFREWTIFMNLPDTPLKRTSVMVCWLNNVDPSETGALIRCDSSVIKAPDIWRCWCTEKTRTVPCILIRPIVPC